MKFINKTIDYCSSKLKYNKRFMKWNLKGHPLNFKDKRFYFLVLLLLLPTIEMAICIHVVKDLYLAIVVFHLTITVGPIIYLFLNSKLIKEDSYYDNSNNYNQSSNPFRDSSINSVSISINNNQLSDSIYNSNNNHKNKYIYNSNNNHSYNNDDNDNDDDDDGNSNNKNQYNNNKEDEQHLIDIYSRDLKDNISLRSKIFKSLFSVPQFIIGLILMTAGLLFGLLCYYLLAYFIPNVVSKLNEYGMLSYSFFAEYIFYIYFSLINPILEEWFWRMFLLNTFGSTKLKRLIITACYSFYHFVVLTVFYNIFFSMFLTVVVFIGGILFLYITKYIGPLASILSHTAADLMIVCIISNWTLKYFPYLHYN